MSLVESSIKTLVDSLPWELYDQLKKYVYEKEAPYRAHYYEEDCYLKYKGPRFADKKECVFDMFKFVMRHNKDFYYGLFLEDYKAKKYVSLNEECIANEKDDCICDYCRGIENIIAKAMEDAIDNCDRDDVLVNNKYFMEFVNWITENDISLDFDVEGYSMFGHGYISAIVKKCDSYKIYL